MSVDGVRSAEDGDVYIVVLQQWGDSVRSPIAQVCMPYLVSPKLS